MSALKRWLEHRNEINVLFGEKHAIPFPTTPIECRELIKVIECALEPENLSCDGELDRETIDDRYNFLMAVQDELEAIINNYVDPEA